MSVSRIAPVDPPYEPDVGDLLRRMMPPGAPPIALFRTFARNLGLGEAMLPWGSYLLSSRLSVSMRDREIVIDRTTARCGCEYEWGVHVTFFADRVGLTPDQVTATVDGDLSAFDDREALLVRMVDELHDTGQLTDELWSDLRTHYSEEQMLDLIALVGWYHAISFLANGARVTLEDGGARFPSVRLTGSVLNLVCARTEAIRSGPCRWRSRS